MSLCRFGSRRLASRHFEYNIFTVFSAFELYGVESSRSAVTSVNSSVRTSKQRRDRVTNLQQLVDAVLILGHRIFHDPTAAGEFVKVLTRVGIEVDEGAKLIRCRIEVLKEIPYEWGKEELVHLTCCGFREQKKEGQEKRRLNHLWRRRLVGLGDRRRRLLVRDKFPFSHNSWLGLGVDLGVRISVSRLPLDSAAASFSQLLPF